MSRGDIEGETRIGDHPAGLFGRDIERRLLNTLVESLTAGGGRRAVIFRGDAGIGKTALIAWACTAAERAGCRVVRLRPTAGSDTGQLLGAIVGSVGSDVRILDDGPNAVLATANALSAVAALSPILIALDDIHTLGPDAFEAALDSVALVDGSVGLIGATRMPVAQHNAPRGDIWVDERPLDGLDVQDIARLATSILGGPLLPSAVEQLHARTWGNPLFASETLRLWKVDGVLVPNAQTWTLREDLEVPYPAQLQDALVASVSALGDSELGVVRALAAIARPVVFEDLATLSGADPDALVRVIHTLDARGMIEGGPRTGYRLAHPGHEEAMRLAAGETALAELSDRILTMLRTYRDAGKVVSEAEMATHALRALRAPDDLCSILEAAANAARAASHFEEASRWWAALEDNTNSNDPRHIEAIIGRAEALVRTQPDEALDLFDRAEACIAADEIPLHILIEKGNALSTLGRGQEALGYFERAAAIAPDDPAVRTRLATSHVRCGNGTEGMAMLEAIAEEGGAEAAGALAFFAHNSGDLRGARAILERGLTFKISPRDRAFLRNSLGWILVEAGAWDEAVETLDGTMAEATVAGDHLRLWRTAAGAVRLHAWRGDIIRSLDLATQTLRAAVTLGGRYIAISAYLSLAECHIEAGAPREALEATQAPLQAHLREVDDSTRANIQLVLLEARIASGDTTVTDSEIEEVRQELSKDMSRRLTIARVQAMRHLSDGDPASAVEAVSEHIAGESPFVFEQARLLQVAADALWRTRRRAAARDAAVRALQTYERLGARLRQSAMAAWLYERFSGESRGAPDPHGLTQREHEIMSLAAQGLTNAEIAKRLYISPGTVKKHIENILAKTGARRRSDLHRFLQRDPNRA